MDTTSIYLYMKGSIVRKQSKGNVYPSADIKEENKHGGPYLGVL